MVEKDVNEENSRESAMPPTAANEMNGNQPVARPEELDLSHGENEQARKTTAKDGAQIDGAKKASAQVVSSWRGSYDEMINACEAIAIFIEGGPNADAKKVFIGELVCGGVLSQEEAQLGTDASKVSKSKKIGKVAALLRDDQVRPFLGPSHSTLYAVSQLAEALPDKGKLTKLVKIFKSSPGGEVTRSFVESQVRLLKGKQNAEVKKQSARSWPRSMPRSRRNSPTCSTRAIALTSGSLI